MSLEKAIVDLQVTNSDLTGACNALVSQIESDRVAINQDVSNQIKGINAKLASDLETAHDSMPFVAYNKNPYMSDGLGDINFYTHNPDFHTVSWEMVEPEHNVLTQKMGEVLGGWTDPANPSKTNRRNMTILSYRNPRFIKVTVKRNPEGKRSWGKAFPLMFTGSTDRYAFNEGNTSALIGLFAMEKGRVVFNDGAVVEEGQMVQNLTSGRFRGPPGKEFGGSGHWDYFTINGIHSDGTAFDELVFYIGMYINCAGWAKDWRKVAIPNHWRDVGYNKQGYMSLPNGLMLQWDTVLYERQDEQTFDHVFPIAFQNNCLSVQLSSHRPENSNDADMWPTLVEVIDKSRVKLKYTWSGGAQRAFGFSYLALGY